MHHDHTTPASSHRKLALALALTAIIFLVELVGGFATRSLALLSDSAHVFMDGFALALSYLAVRAASIPANERHSYGYHRMQVLAALFNGASLLFISYEILKAAIARFQNPEPINTGPMLIIAVIGLLVNILIAWVLHEHDHNDLNTRSAFLHILADTLASVGVIAAGLVIYFTGLTWVDPLISVMISLLILITSGRLLKQTVHILAEGMPPGMTTTQVVETIRTVPEVAAVHDLHVWAISPSFIALSAHVVVEDLMVSRSTEILKQIKALLAEKHHIHHVTVQFECENCGQCLPNERPPASSQ